MEERILRTIAEHNLIEHGDRILVAVSGGPDSIALLHWLWKGREDLGIIISCAHYNHGLRGDESDDDERYVESICRMWSIPFLSEQAQLKELLKEGGNLQEIAREYRYRFLLRAAEKVGATKVALAHHGDDQVETVLMRLIRGTGSSGLSGIPYKRALSPGIEIIRPFLDISKEEILKYLKLHRLEGRIDSSNLKTDYTRNRIRLELLPKLYSYNPKVASSIQSLTRMLKEDEEYLEAQAKQMFTEHIELDARLQARVKLVSWRMFPLSLQRRIIKLICNYLTEREEEVPYIHIEAIREIFAGDTPRQWELPWGLVAVARYGEGIIKKKAENRKRSFHYPILVPGSVWISELNAQFTCSVTSVPGVDDVSREVYFDYDCLKGNLILRSRKPGDRIWLEGLGGHKKVKDIFIDEKIPQEERERVPLLFAGEDLIWIPGIRKSSHGAVSSNTKRFLCCKYEKL